MIWNYIIMGFLVFSSIFGALLVYANMMNANRYEYGLTFLPTCLGTLIAVVCSIGLLDFSDYYYKQGQIDALNGKVIYTKVYNDDLSWSWEISAEADTIKASSVSDRYFELVNDVDSLQNLEIKRRNRYIDWQNQMMQELDGLRVELDSMALAKLNSLADSIEIDTVKTNKNMNDP